MDELKAQQIVKAHRQALILTGNLSDWHIEQMKYFPYVAFKDEPLMEVHYLYDFGNVQYEAGSVEYHLYLDRDALLPEFYQASIGYLTMWTKDVFFQETKVEVFIKRWVPNV